MRRDALGRAVGRAPGAMLDLQRLGRAQERERGPERAAFVRASHRDGWSEEESATRELVAVGGRRRGSDSLDEAGRRASFRPRRRRPRPRSLPRADERRIRGGPAALQQFRRSITTKRAHEADVSPPHHRDATLHAAGGSSSRRFVPCGLPACRRFIFPRFYSRFSAGRKRF